MMLHESRFGGLASGPRTFLHLLATLSSWSVPGFGDGSAANLQASPSQGLPKSVWRCFRWGG